MPQNPYYENMLAAIAPKMKDQQQAMYQWMLAQGQRTGLPSAMSRAGQAVAPYAQALGESAVKSAAEAERLKQRESEFGRQLKLSQATLAEKTRQFNEQLAAQEAARDQAARMAMFEYTGFTPEMLSDLGYDTSKMSQRHLATLLERRGFKNPLTATSGPTGSNIGNVPLTAANKWGGKTGLIYA